LAMLALEPIAAGSEITWSYLGYAPHPPFAAPVLR
jgi:hypothetical protein